MKWTPYHYWMWFWCWACFKAYMNLPTASTHHSRYGRFLMWLLGYAGAYAHSDDGKTFHLCDFFYPTRQAQSDAWDLHTTKTDQGAGR